MDSAAPLITVDLATLEKILKLLADANRLELLSLLRRPRVIDEIHLTPTVTQRGTTPDRSITRPAVQNHVDRLLDAGILRVHKTRRLGGRPVNEYVLDQAALFMIIEEVRTLARLEAFTPPDMYATQSFEGADGPTWTDGPKLVLVHGVEEGKVFPLRTEASGNGRGLVLGRKPGSAIHLPFDPSVSAENSEVLPGKDGFRLLDLRSSRNGTFLNWSRLPVGGEAALEPGDVIGVGRSLLVFRAH